MRITKKETKLMAFITTFVMMLSCLVVAPSTNSKAADVTPTVKVKGATLRFEGTEDGKQSMRIGVVVKKADLATACGMQIEYKGNSVTIATDTGYDKIYDYDEQKQEVVYTAVIKNIPSTAFADDFTITGLVKAEGDADYTSSSAVKKSIDSIVDSLGTDYKLADGILLKKASEMDINNVNDGEYAWEQTVIDYGCKSEVVEYKGENCLKVSQGTRVKNGETIDVMASVKFKFSEKNSDGRKFFVEVDACSDSGYTITSYSPEKKQAGATDFLKTGYFITGNGAYGYEQFTVKPITETDDLYVKSFVVYSVVSSLGYDDIQIDRGFVTLSAENETINDPINQISYADGKANVTKLAKDYGGFGVAYNFKPMGKKIDLSEYSQIKLDITSEMECPLCIKVMNNITGDGYWSRIGSPSGAVKYFTTNATTKTYVFDISELKGSLTEAEAVFIKLNPPEAPAEGEDTRPHGAFTINSIQLV